MSTRGQRATPCAPTAVKGAMQAAQVRPSDLAHILGIDLRRMQAMLAGKLPFTVDQLLRCREYFTWCYREKGLLPKLAEQAEREQNEVRGLPEQFAKPTVTLYSCPDTPPGGIWLMPVDQARRIDEGRKDGLIHTILSGPPHYIYVVPMEGWEQARDMLEHRGFIVVNRNAPEGWDVSNAPSDLIEFGEEDIQLV